MCDGPWPNKDTGLKGKVERRQRGMESEERGKERNRNRKISNRKGASRIF